MFKFIFQILAMPVRFLAWISAVLRVYNPLVLLKLAWRLSQDTQDAMNIVSLTFGQQGIRAAEDIALTMFEKTFDAQPLVTLCWLEIQQENDLDAAKYYMTLGTDRGRFNTEMFLPVKLFLSNHFVDFSKEQILDEVLNRNDLPFEFSRGALLDRAAIHLKDNRWKEAEKIADRVLSIEDQPNAFWVKWVTSTVSRDEKQAARWLKKMQKLAGPNFSQILLALGWLYMGNKKQACIELHKAQQYVSNLEMFDKDLAELAKTAQYFEIVENKNESA